MNVLIVEDNDLHARVIKESIEALQHDATIAATGRDALYQAMDTRFDLVLLDIHLPDCMGHHIIPDLRKMQSDIRVVTVTGYNFRELEMQVRQAGVDYYMIKPFSLRDLEEILFHLSKRSHACPSKPPP